MPPEKWSIPELTVIFIVFQVHFAWFIFIFATLNRILLKRTPNYMFLKLLTEYIITGFEKNKKIAHLQHNALFWIFSMKHWESFACFVRHPWDRTLNLCRGCNQCQQNLPLTSSCFCFSVLYLHKTNSHLKSSNFW